MLVPIEKTGVDKCLDKLVGIPLPQCGVGDLVGIILAEPAVLRKVERPVPDPVQVPDGGRD